jgi:hypothetical protein
VVALSHDLAEAWISKGHLWVPETISTAGSTIPERDQWGMIVPTCVSRCSRLLCMSIYAAVDSNALTYLVNAIGVEGYDPAKDSSGLAYEQVAMSRLFMYGDCRLWVPPAVRAETDDIPPGQLRDAQNRTTWYQLLDHGSGVPASVIERVKELLPHHAGLSDCRVVAETEAMELGYPTPAQAAGLVAA